jgi:2-methylcitrate dehydratase PrpD
VSARAVAAQVDAFARELSWADVPSHVQRQLGLLLLDHAAICEGGRLAPASRIAAEHASEIYGGDAATSLLDGRRLSVPGAAWANGVLANALDFDDGHRLTKGHPGAIVIPAALAVVEHVGASVEELYASILVGYEVAIRAGSCSTRVRSSITRPRPGADSGSPSQLDGCSGSIPGSCATPSASPSTTPRSR